MQSSPKVSQLHTVWSVHEMIAIWAYELAKYEISEAGYQTVVLEDEQTVRFIEELK